MPKAKSPDITYEWSIVSLETAPTQGELQMVIKTIHWFFGATASDGLTASSYGSVGVESPDADSFVPYANLTKATIEGWLEAKLDGEQMRQGLSDSIEQQRNPPIVSAPLPWAS